MDERMDDRPLDREKVRAAIRRVGGEHIFYMQDDAITLLPEAKLRKLIENYLDATELCSYGTQRQNLLADAKAFQEASQSGSNYNGAAGHGKNREENPIETLAWIRTDGITEFLEFAINAVLSQCWFERERIKEDASISSENLWIRFQPFDRLVPPLKITLSPAVTEMIRSASVT